MQVEIRQGSTDELVSVNAGLEEFITPYQNRFFKERLAGKNGYGIARKLRQEQETWIRAQGYSRIHVKPHNRYRVTLQFLISEQYSITRLEPQDPPRKMAPLQQIPGVLYGPVCLMKRAA